MVQLMDQAWINAAVAYADAPKGNSEIDKHVDTNLVKNDSIKNLFANLYNPTDVESTAHKDLEKRNYLK